MDKKKIGISVAALLVVFVCILAVIAEEQPTQAGNIVIVLDAGHDDSHTGARGNGLNEENLNLQIALACKNELETYEGVTVYMVRETGACPYGGQSGVGSSTKCNLRRVEFAKSVGASAYISIHNNSSSNTSARGAGVYYPNKNYNYSCGAAGEGLANAVLKQLVSVGLQNRGISVRYSEDNSRYPDGSLADYYGVIKNSKLKGFPGIIIEHAFVSNYSDATQYLNSNEKLWRLGVLDATGIANYYGLKKKASLDYSQAVISNYAQNHNMEFCVQAENIIGANQIQFAVWSSAGGQDDLRWYEAAQSGSTSWLAVVPIWQHATEGEYRVDAYVNGGIYVGGTKFQVNGPSIRGASVLNQNHMLGSFDIQVDGVSSDTDIDSVVMAVWCKNDASSLKWCTPQSIGNGSYLLHINKEDFGNQYGEYQIDTYVRDANAINKCVDSRTVMLINPNLKLEVIGSAASSVFELKLSGNMEEDRIMGVKFLVTPQEGAELSYDAEADSFGQWRACIYPAELEQEGSYNAKAYVIFEDGQERLVGEVDWTATKGVYEIESRIQEQNQRIWSWQDLEVLADAKLSDYVLQIQPWCDYRAIREALANTPYQEFLAYQLHKLPVDSVSGSTITATPEAVTGDAVERITFTVPEFMRDREITVLASTGDSLALTPLEVEWSEDRTQVIVYTQPEGCFVLAAEKPRIKGDANSDRMIGLMDARMILRAVMNIEPLDTKVEKFCDMDEDGYLTLNDVQVTLRLALGIEKNY